MKDLGGNVAIWRNVSSNDPSLNQVTRTRFVNGSTASRRAFVQNRSIGVVPTTIAMWFVSGANWRMSSNRPGRSNESPTKVALFWNAIPILDYELTGRRSDRHHQVRLPCRQPREQKLDKRLFEVWLSVAGDVQRNLVNVDALPELLSQCGLERGRLRRERRSSAPEGVHDEDALGLGAGGRVGHESEDDER
jgi:hypothetical protein